MDLKEALHLCVSKSQVCYDPIQSCETYMTGYIQRCPLFLRSLSLYCIKKQAHNYRSQNLIVFKNQISQYKIYLLNFVLGYFYLFTIYSPVAKGVPISVLSFFCFLQNLHFRFYISKYLTVWKEISL